ncbi:MAG: hypothetical protein Q7K42_01600 [Candidatus Diapherotrites archaeon]|nr:hypothetical protein [Candidatus Diapherotrites archaeon]
MDFGKMFSSSWKFAALVAVVWGVVAGVIGLIPLVNVIALLVIIPVGFVLPVVLGFLSTKSFAGEKPFELAESFVNGGVAGLIYGLAGGIVGVIFSALGLVLGIGVTAATGDPTSAAVAGGAGIIGLILFAVIGIPMSMVMSAVLSGIGGAIYSVIKK